MSAITMEDVSHKVVRLEEKVAVHETNINRLESIADKLVETAQNQSHTVDMLVKKAETDKNIEARLDVLEKLVDRAQFMSKVFYTIVTTPTLVGLGYLAFSWLKVNPLG